jgi:hypothetical protein
MDIDAEIIIPPETYRPFLLSHRSKPTFEFQLTRAIPREQIRECPSERYGFKTWEISRKWLPVVSNLVKSHFGWCSISRSRTQPVNPKDVDGQLSLFHL